MDEFFIGDVTHSPCTVQRNLQQVTGAERGSDVDVGLIVWPTGPEIIK